MLKMAKLIWLFLVCVLIISATGDVFLKRSAASDAALTVDLSVGGKIGRAHV